MMEERAGKEVAGAIKTILNHTTTSPCTWVSCVYRMGFVEGRWYSPPVPELTLTHSLNAFFPFTFQR